MKGSSDEIRNLKKENLNLVDELKKVNLESKEAMKTISKIIANNLSLKKENLNLVDELKKVKLEAKEAMKTSTKIIANNLSLKHQLDTVGKDAKRVDLRENEMLKEIEKIKRTRQETEACNKDLSGKNSHLTDKLEVSKKLEDYVRTIVISLDKQKAIFKDQISSQKAKISDSEKKAKVVQRTVV